MADVTPWLSITGWTVTADSTGFGTPLGALTGTGWQSGSGAYPHWVAVDMQTAQTFDQLMWYSNIIPGFLPGDMEIYVSDDGAAWTLIATANGSGAKRVYVRFPRQTARYFKLQALNGGGAFIQLNGMGLIKDHGHGKYGWTATASSTAPGYAASTLVDGLISSTNLWYSNAVPPQWIAVDMGTAQSIDYVRFWPDLAWGWSDGSPYWVELYVGDDGVNWDFQSRQLWPAGLDDQFIYTSGTATVRHFKLQILAVNNGVVRCTEVAAGLRVAGEAYKVYTKCYAQQSQGYYVGTGPLVYYPDDPGPLYEGRINSLTTRTMNSAVGLTTALRYYPESVFWSWDFPAGYESITYYNKLMVVEGSHANGPVVGTAADGTLTYDLITTQSYFDFKYQWLLQWNWSGAKYNDVTALTITELAATYSHLYQWGALATGPDPEHPAVFDVTDHYILLVYDEVYTPPLIGLVSGICLATREKHPSDRIDIGIDWLGWLGADTIQSSTWAATTGLSCSVGELTATATTVEITGGTSGADYDLKNTITTTGGRTEVRRIRILCRTCSAPDVMRFGWATNSPT